jgi:hypothetical protein
MANRQTNDNQPAQPGMSFHNEINSPVGQLNQGVVNQPSQINNQTGLDPDSLERFRALLTDHLRDSDASQDIDIVDETVAFLRRRMDEPEPVLQAGDEVVGQDGEDVLVVDHEAQNVFERLKVMVTRNYDKFGPAILRAAAAVLTAASATNPILAGLVTLLTELSNMQQDMPQE